MVILTVFTGYSGKNKNVFSFSFFVSEVEFSLSLLTGYAYPVVSEHPYRMEVAIARFLLAGYCAESSPCTNSASYSPPPGRSHAG